MMPTLLGGVVLSYIAIDNMLEGPLRIFLKDYIDLKEFGSNIREQGLFYLILGLGIFQIIIALQSFIQPVIEINNGRIATFVGDNIYVNLRITLDEPSFMCSFERAFERTAKNILSSPIEVSTT